MTREEDKKEERLLTGRRNMWIMLSLASLVTMLVMAYDGRDRIGIVLAILSVATALCAWVPVFPLKEVRERLRSDTDAVSPVIAVILMVAITVVLAATVFVLVADIHTQSQSPSIGWSMDDGENTLTVTSVSQNGLKWASFGVTGCTAPDGNETVDATDKLTGCAGDVTVVHKDSNTMIYQGRFT